MNKKIIISIAVLLFIILMFSVVYEDKEPEIDNKLPLEESPPESQNNSLNDSLKENIKEPLNKENIKEPLNKENIKANMFAAYYKIDTYKININGAIIQKVFFTTVDVNIDAKGQVDNKNQKMQVSMDLSIPLKGTELTELHITDDALYKKQSGEWMKKELSESERSSIWDKNDFIKREIELINSSEIEFIGNETAGGDDLSVVKITPGEESLKVYVKSWLEQFSEIGPEEYGNLLHVSGLEFKNASFEYRIEKDTYLIKEEHFRADVVTDDENYKIKISVEFYDYNEPVNIILPDEDLF